MQPRKDMLLGHDISRNECNQVFYSQVCRSCELQFGERDGPPPYKHLVIITIWRRFLNAFQFVIILVCDHSVMGHLQTGGLRIAQIPGLTFSEMLILIQYLYITNLDLPSVVSIKFMLYSYTNNLLFKCVIAIILNSFFNSFQPSSSMSYLYSLFFCIADWFKMLKASDSIGVVVRVRPLIIRYKKKICPTCPSNHSQQKGMVWKLRKSHCSMLLILSRSLNVLYFLYNEAVVQ